jgi:hypothetical protein
MSDERELTSAEEERVRRLLAEARVDAPIPEDVAARLDRVLAQLGEGEPGPDAHVVALASRRRRKVTALLVAAAAVVAVGVGIGQVVPRAEQSDSSPASDAGEAGAGDADDLERAAPDAAAERDAAPFDLVDGVPRVRATRFADDVARVAELRTTKDADGSGRPSALQSEAESSAPVVCDPAAWGRGRLQVVRYDGQAAVLAFRPPMGDAQVVDLLQCGTGELLRSVTLAVD